VPATAPAATLTRQYAKLCDLADFADDELAAAISDIKPTASATRPHRKPWEFAMGALFLRDAGRLDGDARWDRAVGPMQFLPSTWAAYGSDGDGDGLSDVMNPADAMQGAARLLCANGGADTGRLPSAIWNYNHSDDYVRQVLALARFTPN
jgi:hypothetical protein